MNKEQLQALYTTLAQKLGNLEYKKSQMEEEIKQIRQELYGLNFVNSVSEQLLAEETKKQQLLIQELAKKQLEERAKSELQAKSPSTTE